MTSIALEKAVEEWIETIVIPTPPCHSGSLTCLFIKGVSSIVAHSSKQWRIFIKYFREE